MPTNEIAAFVTEPMVDLSWWESRTKNNVLWGRVGGLPITYKEIYTHTYTANGEGLMCDVRDNVKLLLMTVTTMVTL